MKIRMKTLMAGPARVRHPGEVCVVSPDEGAMLVDGGYAEIIEPEEVRKSPEKTETFEKTEKKAKR